MFDTISHCDIKKQNGFSQNVTGIYASFKKSGWLMSETIL